MKYILALILSLSGCSFVKDEVKPGGVLQTYGNSCGVAVLATVINRYGGYSVDEELVLNHLIGGRMKVPHILDQEEVEEIWYDEVNMEEMVQFVAAYYPDVVLQRIGIEESIAKDDRGILLDQAIPCIVRIQQKGFAHFVVVVSADAIRLDCFDPQFGDIVYERSDFYDWWERAKVGTKLLLLKVEGREP